LSSSSYFGLIKYVNAMSRFSMPASVNDIRTEKYFPGVSEAARDRRSRGTLLRPS
jgi:hypothetical protein